VARATSFHDSAWKWQTYLSGFMVAAVDQPRDVISRAITFLLSNLEAVILGAHCTRVLGAAKLLGVVSKIPPPSPSG